MKRIAALFLVLILVFSLTAAGCSLFGVLTRTSTPVKTEIPATGVLKLLSVDPTTLDPAVASESTSNQYIMLIYSGLLKLGANMEPVGDIAESWTVSRDGLVYTFKLRQDVRFHNGRAVTAHDFKYSWERAANPATNSHTAETYLGDIVGVDEVISGRANTIRGVTVVDNYTLAVRIDTPKTYFIYKMSYPTTFVVERESVNKGPNWWQSSANGTGPFKLSNWTLRQSLTLNRNEYYYGVKPKLASIKYQFYSGLSMDLYETGSIDITGVSAEYIDAVMDQNGPFYKDLTVSSELSVGYIGFNCTTPPFDDPHIRRAFNLAIDKDKIVSLIYRNTQNKANGLLPPGIPGYNPRVRGLPFDPVKARELIKSSKYAGIENIPMVTLTTYGYGGSASSLIQALVYQWQENLGIKVRVRQLATERYFYKTKTEIDQMYQLNWMADYPHPQNILDILFHSDANYNYGGYNNSQFDALIKRANESLDEKESFALYQEAEQILVDDAGCIPLTFGMNYTLVKYYVKNFRLNPMGLMTLQDIWLER